MKFNKKETEFINQLIEKWKILNDNERKNVSNELNIPNFYELMNSIISD